SENILSEEDVRKKWHFDAATWERLGEDEALVEAIALEKVRRQRSGATKRELAQKHIVKAPDILNGIMIDPAASPKNRIDASKTLDAFAANGPGATPNNERFSIVINLSADEKIRIDKPIAAGVDDDGNVIDAAPQGLLPMIAMNKRSGGND